MLRSVTTDRSRQARPAGSNVPCLQSRVAATLVWKVMAVDRLTAEDRLMLWSDESWPQDIGALAVLDGRTLIDSDGRFRIEVALEAIHRRLHLLPRFRQILYQPRPGLGWPLWVDAPGFDLRNHVRVAHVPDPGDESQLLMAVEQLRARRLDRSRPLWEISFLPGLPGRTHRHVHPMASCCRRRSRGCGKHRVTAGYIPRHRSNLSAAVDTRTTADGPSTAPRQSPAKNRRAGSGDECARAPGARPSGTPALRGPP